MAVSQSPDGSFCAFLFFCAFLLRLQYTVAHNAPSPGGIVQLQPSSASMSIMKMSLVALLRSSSAASTWENGMLEISSVDPLTGDPGTPVLKYSAIGIKVRYLYREFLRTELQTIQPIRSAAVMAGN